MSDHATFSLADSIVYDDGVFRPYHDVRLGLLTHALHYGTGCFEGIRGYWLPEYDELALLHLREHYQRLAASARMLFMKLPHTVDELVEITKELCRRNKFRHGIYLRPFLFKSLEAIGVRLHDIPERFALVAVPFARYIDAEGGLRVGTSGWRRVEDTMMPARAKITGVYVNSALAKSEAILAGFDEAIMLSHDGHVAEGSAENLFVVKNGRVITPDPSQNILEGITRQSIMTLLTNELGIEVVERAVDRTELFHADELFFTGTAIGIEPIAEVDHRRIGNGTTPITTRLISLYHDAVHGKLPTYQSWLTPVYRENLKTPSSIEP